jgi:hypothetical protein
MALWLDGYEPARHVWGGYNVLVMLQKLNVHKFNKIEIERNVIHTGEVVVSLRVEV